MHKYSDIVKAAKTMDDCCEIKLDNRLLSPETRMLFRPLEVELSRCYEEVTKLKLDEICGLNDVTSQDVHNAQNKMLEAQNQIGILMGKLLENSVRVRSMIVSKNFKL